MSAADFIDRKCSRCSAWFSTRLVSHEVHCPACWQRLTTGFDPIRYWARWQALSGYRGTGHAPFPPLPPLCAIAGCWRHSLYEGGMCPSHRARQARYGGTYAAVPITANGLELRVALRGGER